MVFSRVTRLIALRRQGDRETGRQGDRKILSPCLLVSLSPCLLVSAFLLLLGLQQPACAHTPASPPANARYHFELPRSAQNLVSVRQRVTWINRHTRPAAELVFNAFPLFKFANLTCSPPRPSCSNWNAWPPARPSTVTASVCNCLAVGWQPAPRPDLPLGVRGQSDGPGGEPARPAAPRRVGHPRPRIHPASAGATGTLGAVAKRCVAGQLVSRTGLL